MASTVLLSPFKRLLAILLSFHRTVKVSEKQPSNSFRDVASIPSADTGWKERHPGWVDNIIVMGHQGQNIVMTIKLTQAFQGPLGSRLVVREVLSQVIEGLVRSPVGVDLFE